MHQLSKVCCNLGWLFLHRKCVNPWSIIVVNFLGKNHVNYSKSIQICIYSIHLIELSSIVLSLSVLLIEKKGNYITSINNKGIISKCWISLDKYIFISILRGLQFFMSFLPSGCGRLSLSTSFLGLSNLQNFNIFFFWL